MLAHGKCECFVMQMYVCGLCASCGSSQCCVLHDLQFVNSGRGCKGRPYGTGLMTALLSHCLLLFTPLLFVEVCVRVQDVVNACAVCELWV